MIAAGHSPCRQPDADHDPINHERHESTASFVRFVPFVVILVTLANTYNHEGHEIFVVNLAASANG